MADTASTKPIATYILAFSIFALALALVYFTVQIASISRQIPAILNSVENTSGKIEPVIAEIGNLRDLVPPVLEEVRLTREQIPPILNEVAKVRQQIPPILTEMAQVRQQLPLILEEAKNTRQMIPRVLKTVNGVTQEVEKIRPLVPKVLTQVEKTREAIPEMMDRADKLVAQARQAGQEASKGAVTGVLTGIITAPFNLIGSLGKKVLGISEEEQKQLTDQDIKIMTQSGQILLNSNEVNLVQEWKNPESNHHGKMTLNNIKVASAGSGEPLCKDIHLEVWESNKVLLNKVVTYCLYDKTGWQPKSQ